MPLVLKQLPFENQDLLTQVSQKVVRTLRKVETKQEKVERTQIGAVDSKSANLEQEEIIHIFMSLIQRLLQDKTKPDSISFQHKQICFTSIRSLLNKTYTLTKGQDSYFVTAMIFLDRVHSLNENITFDYDNIRLYTTAALLLALKYCDDSFYFNSEIAKSAELDKSVLNKMEVRFLILINFELYIDAKTYQLYEKKIINYSQKKKKSLTCQTQ